MDKNEKIVVELWHEAVSPKCAAWVNYIDLPAKFCVPGYLCFLASVTHSLFVCCESKYGCRQFSPLFDADYYDFK